MPHSFILDRLEDRRLASVSRPIPIALLDVTSPFVKVDQYGQLHVRTTAADDYVSIRAAGAGRTQIDITTTYYVSGTPAHGSIVTSPENVALTASETADPDVTQYTAVSHFTLPRGAFTSVAVDAEYGHDVLRVRGLHTNPAGTSIERTIIVQTPAPAGQTMSDPATGRYNQSAAAWAVKLKQQLAQVKTSHSPIAFFGDSHAERYLFAGHRSWNAAFKGSLNLGTSGDSSRQLLARINAGLFDHYKPRTLVVMVGTNNLIDPAAGGTDRQVLAGVSEVISALRRKLPDTQFILPSVFPRREAGLNTRIETLNAGLANLGAAGYFHFLDVYSRYVGTPVQNDVMAGDNHLSAKGYAVLTAALLRLLKTI